MSISERCTALVHQLQEAIADDTEGECLRLGSGLVLDKEGRVCVVFLVPVPQERVRRAHPHEMAMLESLAADRALS